MTAVELQTVKLAIVELKKLGMPNSIPDDPNLGICHHINNVLWFRLATLPHYRKILRRWPRFSGEDCYPVPCPGMEPYHGFVNTPNLWEGRYGQYRRQYARYLAREYTRLLQKHEKAV